jgi:hypothetical protein
MQGKVQFEGRWIEETTVRGGPPPAVGSDIYVRTAWYLSHGADDFEGGLCKVTKVTVGMSAGNPTWYVEVAERPGHSYNWAILREEQESLAEEHGNRRGYPNPDNDPESNRW